MIWGRPPNLILGAFTATFNVIVLAAAAQGIIVDPGLTAAVNLAAGAIIAVIAYQPPTLAPGDTYKTATPAGEPNYVSIVAEPPAPTKPVEIPPAA
jgi:hypothetical protein